MGCKLITTAVTVGARVQRGVELVLIAEHDRDTLK